VVALGKFREAAQGDIEPREVMILVEWESRQAFEHYCTDPELADLHPHREDGTSAYIWHLYDRLEDLRPVLK
jgi:heme-degrading monooxygenase HmoA